MARIKLDPWLLQTAFNDDGGVWLGWHVLCRAVELGIVTTKEARQFVRIEKGPKRKTDKVRPIRPNA